MTPKSQPKIPRGRHVIEEAARLLRQLRFSERCGAYAEGRRVAVTLAPTRTPGKWEGWCSPGFRADFPGPYDLVCEILPPDEET